MMSPLPLASKPGRCAATRSVNESAPRSTRIQTAQAVMTLVLEKSSQSVSSRAACAIRLDARVAEALEQGELAVASHRDLRAGIPAGRDVAVDQLGEAFERGGGEAQ